MIKKYSKDAFFDKSRDKDKMKKDNQKKNKINKIRMNELSYLDPDDDYSFIEKEEEE